MQDQFFNFEEDESLSGFRLKSLEVLNWGTFSHKSWKINPLGSNSLLTGDIGSGKSTLVDALTTLLVPHQKITYNKAAGSDKRERTLYSYIRGEYKSEKDNSSRLSKSVFLREENSYSVLSAIFFNQRSGENITLAQTFYLKGGKAEKFFIRAGRELKISEDFAGFGNDILNLRKTLRKLESVEVLDSFKDYSILFRKDFGLKSEKALDLFYQTVSMKSVGNLDDFVRNQMLEKPDVRDRINELIRNFKNLTTSHNAVLKAHRQQEQLKPLVKTADKFEKITGEINHLQKMLEAGPSFFASRQITLLEKDILQLESKITRLNEDLQNTDETLIKSRDKEKDISFALQNDRAGQRLREIDRELADLEKEKKRLTEEYDRYFVLAEKLDITTAKSEEEFYRCRKQGVKREQTLIKEIEEITGKLDAVKIRINILEKQFAEIEEEVLSLKGRKTKIPFKNLQIRAQIMESLSLTEKDLPFVGELVMVRESEKIWEGVIERVLHSFGLSLIVPDKHYKRVSSFVNKTDLRGKLVFFRVPDSPVRLKELKIPVLSMINKLDLKESSPYYYWLLDFFMARFDYTCCEIMEDFYHNKNAITKEGLIKSGRNRHEKDDRQNIHDSRRYILGWSNLEKIKTLETLMEKVRSEKDEETDSRRTLEKSALTVREAEQNLSRFNDYTSFSQINWMSTAESIRKLHEEKENLESSSDQLKVLKEEQRRVLNEITGLESRKNTLISTVSKGEERIHSHQSAIKENQSVRDLLHEEEKQQFYPLIEEELEKTLTDLSSINKEQSQLNQKLNKRKSSGENNEKKLRSSLIRDMQKYINFYPDETFESDASVESIPDFRSFLKVVEEDDLPRFESRFKKMLNEGSIHDIAIFKSQLERFSSDIKKSIKEINKSLRGIEYNPGTYIELQIDNAVDVEIRDFNNDMKQCLGNVMGEKDLYNEAKFQQVKKILDRFDSSVTVDSNWTAKVTDVRTWSTFTASERWHEDDTEKEFYSNTAGKSGGQKEKLAYTILASALAYQFNLDQKGSSLRSFRFVVIDEAFGRGSDESTRYGLELFKKLNLQLLIVTPLQKVNIIEEYINTVHLISNFSGQDSRVRNIPIEQYIKEKEEYRKRKQG